MRRIPLRWLMATSFLAVFLLALAVAGGFIYSGLQRVLWGNGMMRMDSHLRYVLGDIMPVTELEVDPWQIMQMVDRPVEVPADFEQRREELAAALSGDSFLVALLDTEGRVLTKAPAHAAATPPPTPEDLARLRHKWDTFGRKAPGPPPAPRMFGPPGGPGPPPGPLRLVYMGTSDRQVLVAPLARNGKLVGFAQMTSSWRFADHMLRSFAAMLALQGLVLALLICGIGVWLASVLARPLELVANTARRVADGDLSARTGMPEGRNEIHQVGSAFDRMAGRVEEAFGEQKRFIGDASHELKTPLTALVGTAHVLRVLGSGGPDERRTRALDTMDRELTRMEGLVTDLLALSRVTESSREAPSDPVDVRALVEEALAAALAGAPNRRVERPPAPEVWLLGDHAGLVRALRNLLDNALRYTPPDRTVRVKVLTAGAEVRLEVEDEGCGIPAAHLAGLGRRFYRADSGRARASGGTGLGLAIARAVAEQHGGRLEIDSVEGKGTRAALVLPLRGEDD